MIQITDANYDEEILKYKGKVILDVGAKWCGKCSVFKPQFIAAESKYPYFKFCIADADEFDAVTKLNVDHIPAVFVFEDGKIVKQGGEEVLNSL